MSTLHLKIVTPEREIFSGDVNMVIAPGSEGDLGILPRHTPLLSGLRPGELRIKRDGEDDIAMAIGGGFIEVEPETVLILADSAERADEIDLARAEAARQRALAALADRQGVADLAATEAALRRALVRLKVARRRRRGVGSPGSADFPQE